MYEALLETYEMISKLEEKESVFGIQERLFLTRMAFHTENIVEIEALISRVAMERQELTTGQINPELKKIGDFIEEKEIVETWNLLEECMNLQEGLKASFTQMDSLYQQILLDQQSGKQQLFQKNSMKKRLKELELEMKKVESSLKKTDQSWEHFLKCEDSLKALGQYYNNLEQKSRADTTVKNQSR